MNHQQVARPAERLDLPRKDLIKTEVVPRRREDRRVRGEGEGAKRAAVPAVTHDVFGGDVLGVGGAASVAAEEHRAAGKDDVAGQVSRLGDLRAELVGSLRRGGSEVAEVVGHPAAKGEG